MSLTPLKLNQEAGNEATLKYNITWDDLDGTASTVHTETLLAAPAGTVIQGAWFRLNTPFDGGNTSAMTLQVGKTGNTNAYITATQVHLDDSEVFYATGNGSAFNQAGGDVITSATNVTATFTATGANCTALTAGSVDIYLKTLDLTKLG